MDRIMVVGGISNNYRLNLAISILLGFLLCTLFSITVVAYDFSGGYTSSRTVGVTEGSILTIGGMSTSSLDIGADGGGGSSDPNSPASSSLGKTILKELLPPLVAFVILVFAMRTGDPRAMLVGLVIGLIAFTVVQKLLESF